MLKIYLDWLAELLINGAQHSQIIIFPLMIGMQTHLQYAAQNMVSGRMDVADHYVVLRNK